MRTLTLEEINALEHGELIPRFQGRITKVFDQKTGEGQRGPWHLQTFMLGAGDQEISVTYTGADLLNTWEGEAVSIECSDNKGKLAGVLRDIRVDKQGKEWRGVKITPACKIRRLDNDSVSNDSEHEPRRSEIEPKLGPPIGNALKPKPNGDKIEAFCAYEGRLFTAAWKEASKQMELLKDYGAEMSAYEWNDLRLRITLSHKISVDKIIRKERF